jgi:hypothetical protein
MSRGRNAVHQEETGAAIKQAWRAAKAAAAAGIAVDRMVIEMPNGTKITMYPAKHTDQSIETPEHLRKLI